MAIQAIVSDQSGDFGSLTIGAGPQLTVIAALDLPPGNWVAFATVALVTRVTGTTIVEMGFLLGGEIYSTFVQSDLVVTDNPDTTPGAWRVVPLTTGLTIDTLQTLQVGCTATQPNVVYSQPTTITAIQVDSMTRIPDQFPGGS